ncbi:hypothetical protein LQR31_08985 [Chromobacterium vaccinii]|uniref:hypothetical protein n=1 Tax=Chromobacterium vaccinii TaxID=1108595 RepID=UPI001E437C0E|nr:hypothetical protein [Chromobacterium vaccinii]MCD4484603.1 hypothetical protein [Chromobacterium vaccinii]
MMVNPMASAAVFSTQAGDVHKNAISALNQFGVELRRIMHPGNKREGLGTNGSASACYAYDMGALYARDRESFQFSKEQALSESTLFQGGLALKCGGGNVAFAAYGNDTGFTPEMSAYAAELYSREGSFVSAWYRERTAQLPLVRRDSDQSMNSETSTSNMSICND